MFQCRLLVVFSCWFLAFGAAASSSASATADQSLQPNVVLILIDDFGWADLGCYGGSYYRTPNIDRLAAQGLRFTQAYSACPVCSPTRAALLTGKYPARLHLTDYIPGQTRNFSQSRLLRPDFLQQLPLEETTIAEVLRSAGYATAAIGKWHLGGEGFEPSRQGFGVAKGGIAAGSVSSHFAPYLRDGATLPGLAHAPDGEYLADRLTTEAEAFIEANRGRPFFLYMPHYAVHTPLQGKADLVAEYEKSVPTSGLQRNPMYAAMVDNMDQSVGRILRKLDELKLADHTLVLFTSDNGGLATATGPRTPATNNAPLREGKGWLYEGGIRVPLIARWPGVIKPGTTVDVPVISCDLPLTIAQACGTSLPQAQDAVSLLSVLKGASEVKREALYWHYPHYSPQGGHPGGAIRQGDYKLIEFYEQSRLELFDVVHDQSENKNLVDQQPQIAARMAASLAAWRTAVDAHMPRPNDAFEPDTQADDGTITLPAETAVVHGVMLRYEPLPHKNTLGFWTRVDDWAHWDFRIKTPGEFTVEMLAGCTPDSAGSQVEVRVGQQVLTAKVVDTGGFANFVPRVVGTLRIPSAGDYRLSVKPLSKPGAAVMDLRQVRLLRVK